jgi:two-component system LytT family response regulator
MSDATPLRVLVVDDEPLGCRRIVALLRDRADVEVVGMAENGDGAVEAIRSKRPDLVFLDIQMPGKTGLDVVEEVGPENMPVTIFVTAYDQFAIRAFDLAAVDYLVKPFDEARFEMGFSRARRKIELEQVERVQSQIRTLLAAGAAPLPAAPPAAAECRYLQRIAVHMRGKTRVVPVSEIDYIRSSGTYTELHAGSTCHVHRESLQALEEQLDPDQFIRIHRTAIVRVSLIEALLRGEGGEYQVQLKNGVTLKISRHRREELEQRLRRNR